VAVAVIAGWLLAPGTEARGTEVREVFAQISDPPVADPPRGDVDQRRLPAGSTVLLQPPPAWQQYRWQILITGAALLVQTLVIIGLAVEHRRRRRAEIEARTLLEEARSHLMTITHLDRRAAIGEVTAAITHELNQPLEAILHNAEAGEMILESGAGSNDEVRQIFADIRRIDTRAAEIVSRLRGLLRRKEFETRPLDVNEVTRETVALVTPVAVSKGARVALDLTDAPVPIVGDRVHLQQVLMNVLLNGIEAMSGTPRERRNLSVSSRRMDGHVEVSVSDCGHGIRAASASQIFEAFYTTKGEGMGIGLSIARTIVEAHGGHIAARNNPDGGATVWFTLPSTEASADHLPPIASAQHTPGARATTLSRALGLQL
jgi:C4-dicarboxylate-specific signal transduction histidine kinase